MKTIIETIPHNAQRYNTCGDWYDDEFQGEKRHRIVVSDTGNEDYNFLIALHELIEQHFCNKVGISEESITAFDKHFEYMRVSFPDLVGDMEPGGHENAPYHKQHKMASMFEKWVADNIAKTDDRNPDEFYEEYNKVVNSL